MKTSLRRVAVSLLPPLVTGLLRRARDRARRKPTPPADAYTTLENPLEVPCQVESYLFWRDAYLRPGDAVLEVGFGLGYGMQIMAAKAERLAGVEVDAAACERARRIFDGHPRVTQISLYDGLHLPFADKTFDAVTCVEVLEHVEDYDGLLREMVRVARRLVFLTTPNRRPEHTLPDGRPRNFWHLREWTHQELDAILARLGLGRDWNFLNGPFEGPFLWTKEPADDTLSLSPVILVAEGGAAH